MNRGRCLAVALVLVAATGLVAQVEVSVDKGVRYQTIEGFGASVTDRYNITPWKVQQGPFQVAVDLDSVGFYDSIITELGATAIRSNIHPGFSPAPGQYGVNDNIRTIIYDLRKLREAARRHREPLVFIGTPWSPPAWMKVNGATSCPGISSSQCRLKDGYEDSLGNYLVKYVQTMTDSGLPYYAVSVQNEPLFAQPFNSCVYDALNYRRTLVAAGRAFDRAGLPQKFFGSEHMSHAFPSQFERAIRADAEALGYIDAWAVHGYTDGVAADTGSFTGDTESDKPLWMTETSGHGYGDTWADWDKAMKAAKSILSYLRDGKMSLWTWWCLQAPEDTENAYAYNLHAGGRPTLKWHVSRHFFRFIRPGARQVSSTSSDGEVLVVATWHEEAECLAIVLANTGTSDKTLSSITVSSGSTPATFERIQSTASEQSVASTVGSSDQITLPAQSVTTLVAGTYRGTDSLTAVDDRPGVSRTKRPATAVTAPQRVYGIDGRLISRSGIHGLRGRRVGSGNVYIVVDTRRGAVKACGQAAVR